jgi:hypothetical protein
MNNEKCCGLKIKDYEPNESKCDDNTPNCVYTPYGYHWNTNKLPLKLLVNFTNDFVTANSQRFYSVETLLLSEFFNDRNPSYIDKDRENIICKEITPEMAVVRCLAFLTEFSCGSVIFKYCYNLNLDDSVKKYISSDEVSGIIDFVWSDKNVANVPGSTRNRQTGYNTLFYVTIRVYFPETFAYVSYDIKSEIYNNSVLFVYEANIDTRYIFTIHIDDIQNIIYMRVIKEYKRNETPIPQEQYPSFSIISTIKNLGLTPNTIYDFSNNPINNKCEFRFPITYENAKIITGIKVFISTLTYKTVIHEFMHVLGFAHTHQIDRGNIFDWNKEAVRKTVNMSVGNLNYNYFDKFSNPPGSISTGTPRLSIMNYEIPKCFTKNKVKTVDYGIFTDEDILELRRAFPPNPQQVCGFVLPGTYFYPKLIGNDKGLNIYKKLSPSIFRNNIFLLTVAFCIILILLVKYIL